MNTLALKLSVTPLLILAANLASRTWGKSIGRMDVAGRFAAATAVALVIQAASLRLLRRPAR